MPLAAWQATIVDEAGNVQAGASIEVRRESTGTLAAIYADRDGNTPLSNPFNADEDGFARFHVSGGAFRITATKGSFSRTWRYVGIGLASEYDDLPSTRVRYDRTASEIAAGVTPVDSTVPSHESAGVVLAERYGFSPAASKTDNDAAIAKAIAVAAQINGTVKVRDGHYMLNDAWDVPHSVAGIVGETREGTIFDFSDSDAVLPNNAFIWSEGGGLVALPALADDVSRTSKVVKFDAAPDLVSGDLLQVYDTADGSFNGHRPEYRAGEFMQVASVTGSEVTVTAFPYATYAAATPTVGIEKVSNPTRVSFRNFSIIGRGQNDYLLRIKYGRGNVVRNIGLRNNTLDAISCSLSYDVTFDRIYCDITNEISGNLVRGLSIHNSQNVTVTGSHLMASRHGLNLGGSEEKAVVNRAVTVSGCVIRNRAAPGSVQAANLHGNAEFFVLSSSVVEGVCLSGNRTAVIGCTIIGNSGRGVHLAELKGLDHSIKANDITIQTYADTQRGCFLDAGGASQEITAVTDQGGTLVFKGNTCRYLTADTAIDGITVRNRGCTAPMHFVFKDNEFIGTVSSTGHRDILFVDVVSGNRIDSVTFSGNKRCDGWGVHVNETAYLEISDNTITNGGHTGIRGGDNKVVRCERNYVSGCQRDGVALDSGSGLGADEICYFNDNVVRENNVTADGLNVAVTLRRFATVHAHRNVWGGSQAGQTRPVSFNTIATLYESENQYYGTGTPQHVSVTTRVPAVVSDSAANDVPGLVSDFNDLLSEMRKGGLIAS